MFCGAVLLAEILFEFGKVFARCFAALLGSANFYKDLV